MRRPIRKSKRNSSRSLHFRKVHSVLLNKPARYALGKPLTHFNLNNKIKLN